MVLEVWKDCCRAIQEKIGALEDRRLSIFPNNDFSFPGNLILSSGLKMTSEYRLEQLFENIFSIMLNCSWEARAI